ncbi:CXXC motif containing zinc binding protein-like [Sycon ciliatum]|uniref:CXXC motif containing zinc binding protein-like n=1 Tax=Sycon ciliatum TaxID=27933 RepID=UPI0031F6BCF2|eukprot:scpid87022/ scgid24375/ UPF0587 protein C1orf123 homolog
MVKISLQMKANLQNVTDMKASGDDFRWYFKVKCLSCGEVSENFIYICGLERSAMPGSRGDANLIIKCKLCSRVNSADLLADTIKAYKAGGSQFQSIVTFECRGLEIVEFSPRSGFVCVGEESGTKFEDVDLTEMEWCDYDEKAGDSVAIDELEFKFVRA